jgi:type IV pilus assembly protein PilB
MNDFATSTQILSRSGLQGLPQRLVSDGLVGDTQMVEAIAAAKERRVGVVSYLVEYNLADAREIAIAASQEFGAPLMDLDAIQPDLDTVRIVSEKILRKHRVLPLVKRGKKLFIAISDPTNLHALDEVKFATGFSIEAIVVEEDKLAKLLTHALEQVDTSMPDLGGEDFEMDGLEVTSGDDDPNKDSERSDAVDDAPIVRFINKVMLDAIKKGASDIHFEPYERSYRIRFRLDGVLKEMAAPPVQLAVKMSARLKVMSRLDIAERRIPQDGRIKMKISKNRAIDFRVSTCPTLFGEKIVMRILDPSSAMLGIDALGYEPFQKKLYLESLARPHGMILVTGPTGSGKSTTLASMIDKINSERRGHIVTIEDPIEYVHEHKRCIVNQREVKADTDSFAAALKHVLRQDPDIILVGEMRDTETMSAALTIAETGHLCLATLHTNSTFESINRITDAFPGPGPAGLRARSGAHPTALAARRGPRPGVVRRGHDLYASHSGDDPRQQDSSDLRPHAGRAEVRHADHEPVAARRRSQSFGDRRRSVDPEPRGNRAATDAGRRRPCPLTGRQGGRDVDDILVEGPDAGR